MVLILVDPTGWYVIMAFFIGFQFYPGFLFHIRRHVKTPDLAVIKLDLEQIVGIHLDANDI